jgi:large subunit ribosomal protein L23
MAELNPYEVIYHPFVTEKAMNLMDKENKLVFVVRRTAGKHDIKKAVEKLFECKVVEVNTVITKKGKRAIVKFHKDYKAEEIGMRIGVF